MKKIRFILLLCVLCLFTACSSKEEPEEKKEEITEEVVVEETKEIEEAEQPREDVEPKEMTLSSEELYKINIFLSNFSEQGFNEYDIVTYEKETTAYSAENADIDQLLQFAFVWHKINSYKSFTYDSTEGRECLTVDQINKALQRYLGLTISASDVEKSTFRIDGNVVSIPAADGESHPGISIIKKMIDNGDGTYYVEFGIFNVEEASTGGNIVDDKSLYYLNYADVVMKDGISSFGSGEAIVKPYKNGDIDSYNLIRYAVGTQEL